MLDKNASSKIFTPSLDRKQINQLEVWRWVMQQPINIGERFYNTLRYDLKPACTLHRYNDTIYLNDWKKPQFHGWTIYEAVHHKYISPFPTPQQVKENFVLILQIIAERPENVHTSARPYLESVKKEPFNFKLIVENQKWNSFLLRDWNDHGIRQSELEEDYVFPVKNYWCNSQRLPHDFNCYQPKKMYDVPTGNRKLYKRKLYSMSPKKFITNAGETLNGKHVGSRVAFVAKFYKDYRVILNCDVSSYYTNGENAHVPDKALPVLAERHERIFLVKDNDQSSIELCKEHCQIANEKVGRELFVPFYTKIAKDPSDVVKNHSYTELKHELDV